MASTRHDLLPLLEASELSLQNLRVERTQDIARLRLQGLNGGQRGKEVRLAGTLELQESLARRQGAEAPKQPKKRRHQCTDAPRRDGPTAK